MRFYGKFPSVTTVTALASQDDFFLQNWLSIPGNKQIAKDSATFGNYVHSYIEKYLKGEPIIYTKRTQEPFLFFDELYKPFCEKNKNGVFLIEEQLTSQRFQVGGTVDLVLKNGFIIDFKTASKPKKKEWLTGYFMQVAAYAALVKENHPEFKINSGLIYMGIRETKEVQTFQLDKDDLNLHLTSFAVLRQKFFDKHGF